ncbi:MAG: hypothetical protein QM669_05885 [Siphonobacter sp.]
MDQRIINLFDEYTHKPLTCQDFFSKLAKVTGSMALAVLPLLEVNYAHVTTIAEDDPDLSLEDNPGDRTTKGVSGST